MNLRDLQYFLAVVDTRNFNRAAEQCHVSQPTLSMQIKKLEELLGVTLFERSNKQVIVTDLGLRLATVARRIGQDVELIREIARLDQDPYAGEFRLGAMPTLASYVFPAYARAVASSFPRLELLLIEEKTERLVQQLKDNKLDAALLALPVEDNSLTSSEIFDDRFMLAVGSHHPLASRKTIAPSDLTGYRLLLLDEGHCLRDQALAVCQAHGADEDKGFRATSLETLRLMVRAPGSQVMTLMPQIAVGDDKSLCYIPFSEPSPSRRIGLVWRKTSARKELIRDLVQLLRSLSK